MRFTVFAIVLVLIPVAAISIADEREVSGVIVDADDRPVEGASVLLSCGVMPDGSVPVLARAMSDRAGRFQFPAPDREKVRAGGAVTVWAAREGLGVAVQVVEVATRRSGGEVKFKFAATKTIAFKVVGPTGEPLGGVRVAPFYVADQSARIYPNLPDELAERLAVESNGDGLVEFGGLPAALEVWRVRVTTPSGNSLVLMPSYDKPPPLQIVLADPAGRISGRVLNSAGQPIAELAVEIWSPGYASDETTPVTIGGRRSFRTDADGTFSVPPGLLAGRGYRAAVRVDGMEPCFSASIQAKAGEDDQVPDLVLRPLREIAGRVLDRAGKPVGGARVMQAGDGPKRTQTETDEQGRFRLDGFRHGSLFVLVDRPGFRFHGQTVDAASNEIEVVLTRADEPAARTLRALASVLPADEERTMALDILKPMARRALDVPADSFSFQAIAALAELEPATVLEWMQTKTAVDPEIAGAIMSEIVQMLAKDDLDEAVSLAATIKDASTRVYALLVAGMRLKADAREKRIELLAQAQLQAQSVESPAERVVAFSRIGGRWYDLGMTDRAGELLRTARELVAANTNDPFMQTARWQLAESLAPIDLPAALELLEGIKQNRVRDRPYLMIAIRLARTNPAEAERIFAKAGESLTGESGGMKNRLCARMAANDLPRARRIAAGIDGPIWKARAMFRIAAAVAASNPAAARDAIDDGFAVLAERDEIHDFAKEAAGVLPLVEQLDASRVEEYMWRAISLRQPMPDVRGADHRSRDDAELARCVAPYDRDVARQLFHTFEDRLASKDTFSRMDAQLEALAMLDPRRAVELATGLPDEVEDPQFPIKQFTLMRVARMLGRHDEARRRAIMESAGFWDEDEGDF